EADEALLADLKANLDAGQLVKVSLDKKEAIERRITEEIEGKDGKLKGAKLQVLSGRMSYEESQRIISNIGKKGYITLIDNANVRGTSPRVDEREGNWDKGIVLHLLYPEEFDTEEEQLIGRIARAGDPGTVKRHYSAQYFSELAKKVEGTESKHAVDNIVRAAEAVAGFEKFATSDASASWGAEGIEKERAALQKNLNGAIESFRKLRFSDRIIRDLRELEAEKKISEARKAFDEKLPVIGKNTGNFFDKELRNPKNRVYLRKKAENIFAEIGRQKELTREKAAEIISENTGLSVSADDSVVNGVMYAASPAVVYELILPLLREQAIKVAERLAIELKEDFLTGNEEIRRKMMALQVLSSSAGTPLEAQKGSTQQKLADNSMEALDSLPARSVLGTIFGSDIEKITEKSSRLEFYRQLASTGKFLAKAGAILAVIGVVYKFSGLTDLPSIGAQNLVGSMNNIFAYFGDPGTVALLGIAALLISASMVFSRTYLKEVTARAKPVKDFYNVLSGTYKGAGEVGADVKGMEKARVVGSFVFYQFVLSTLGFIGTTGAVGLLAGGIVRSLIAPEMALTLPALYGGAVISILIAIMAKALMYAVYRTGEKVSSDEVSRGTRRIDVTAYITGLVSLMAIFAAGTISYAGAGVVAVLALGALGVSRLVMARFYGDAGVFDTRTLWGYGLAALSAGALIAVIMSGSAAAVLTGGMLHIVSIPFAIKVGMSVFSSLKLSWKVSGLERDVLKRYRISGFVEALGKFVVVGAVTMVFSAYAVITSVIPNITAAFSAATIISALAVTAVILFVVIKGLERFSAQQGEEGFASEFLRDMNAQRAMALMGTASAISIVAPQISAQFEAIKVSQENMERIKALPAGLSEEDYSMVASEAAEELVE
nr:hypothetical protein [Candidatus Omnitrophota bacterium]